MIETMDIRVIQTMRLFESAKRNNRIRIINEFTSIYASHNDGFKPYKCEVVKEKPEFGYKIMKEYSKDVPNGFEVAYTMPEEKYIGGPDEAKYLCEKRGLKLETIDDNHRVCSIGKCVYLPENHKDYGKYFGWSHRAMYGFKVGDGYKVKEGHILAGSFPIGFEAKTEEDCRNMAIAFAKEVS